MHLSAMADARRFVDRYLQSAQSIRVADIGSYDVNGTLRPLFVRPGWSYCGMDASHGPNVDRVLSSAYSWPEIPDGQFDVVVSTQTLEHIQRPWKWLPEVARICKSNGLVYVCTPNTWAYHEYPIDCWRAWPDGLRAMFEDAGLDVLEAYHNGPDTTAIGRKRTAAKCTCDKLVVLLVTHGRESLSATLDSLKRQSWMPHDEIVVVHDGPTGIVARGLFNEFSRWSLEYRDDPYSLVEIFDGPHRDWGHTPRNRTLQQIDSGYVVHLDDDDVLAPGALGAIRSAIAEHPGDFFMFRIAYPSGESLWSEPELREGNVGTALFVHPAGIPLGEFAPRHAGDFTFVSETVQKNPDRNLRWRTEATHVIRPLDLWVNPQFKDVGLSGGATGREDCQMGWQDFFGRLFGPLSILDVGAGLCLSRPRLSAFGATVTTQDIAPDLPVDLRCPLSEIPDGSFDVVTAFDVIEHVADPVAFLADLSRIARIAFVVTTPNVWVWHCENRFHIREFSPPMLSHMVVSTPGVRDVDLYASSDHHGARPCMFPDSKFLNVDWPVLGVVGWKIPAIP